MFSQDPEKIIFSATDVNILFNNPTLFQLRLSSCAVTELMMHEFVLSILNKDQNSQKLLIHALCKAQFDKRLQELQSNQLLKSRKKLLQETLAKELTIMQTYSEQSDFVPYKYSPMFTVDPIKLQDRTIEQLFAEEWEHPYNILVSISQDML